MKAIVVLICEVSDGESGAGYLLKAGQPNAEDEVEASDTAFNVGEGLIEGDHAS